MTYSSNTAISVIMPVLNGERYLKESIRSILDQTFPDFEFIIIDDGSTGNTEEIIKSFPDSRIVYIKNDSNLGLSRSFNIGIRAARGRYIARMDADDISLSSRFERQIQFLEEKPDISIVGTIAIMIDENERKNKKINRPYSHIEIKWRSLFSTPLIHPTIMARVQVFKDNPYDESFHNSEDYELWSRLLFTTGIRFANIQDPLLFYRVYKDSFTQKLNPEKRLVSAINSINNIERYTALSQTEKDSLIKLRQDIRLSIRDNWRIWRLYARAARGFQKKEGWNPPLGGLIKFLIKHKIKHI